MNNPIEGEENFENGNEESAQNGVSKINLLEASNSNQEWNHDQIIQKPNGGMESNEENEEWFDDCGESSWRSDIYLFVY